MNKARLETFSDGVIAILITIMVLGLKTPESADLRGLQAILPAILTYLLSFLYLGIYWNNHHHTFVLVDKVSGGVLWANLHLLFWLSLIPFGTVWLGENHSAAVPAAAYGGILLMSAVAYTILLRVIIATQGAHSKLAAAIGDDRKGMISLALYVLAIPLAFVASWMSDLLYMSVALIWFIPDRRIEKRLQG
jgi:uncharacterized membrane protein